MFRNNFLRVILLTIVLTGIETINATLIGNGLLYGIIVGILGMLAFVIVNIFPSFVRRVNLQYRVSSDGADLLTAFAIGIIPQAGIMLYIWTQNQWGFQFWWALIIYIASDFIVFWNGIIRVYLTSPIIGLKWRIIGLLFGIVPIVNLLILRKIIRLIRYDVRAEEDREKRNNDRKAQQLCKTKYPIVMVHGVFFRDLKHLNYWGRIPAQLQINGAEIYYGNQQSALTVEDSAKEVFAEVEKVIKQTGAEKVNIIAHSKGGLDSRYAITHLGMDKYVASLTTINTPHRGCEFADWMLTKAPDKVKNKLADTYNSMFRTLGDNSPDFIGAVSCLTASYCKSFNEKTPNRPGIYYQSTASKINRPVRNVFPLCFTNRFVKHFDGDNDGLVSPQSAVWGYNFRQLKIKSPEGVSHADTIDLTRHNRKDFDVCEFYISLVSELKNMGL